ncbi:MAG: hypothetical protein DRO87_00985 [Candidatus Thorarchaeota archaeon]|nr:MAG: hypothetical protein DRO87_00985 [Candidatus Thorarchaeota archaeon]
MTEDLLSIGEQAVKLAEKLGADQAEAYVSESRSFAIEVENTAIKSADEIRDLGVGVRSVIGKKIGFAYVTTVQLDDIAEIVEKSVQIARASIADPAFETLPGTDMQHPVVKGLYSKEIAELSSDEAASLLLRAIDSSRAVLEGRDFAVSGGIDVGSVHNAVVNSLGVNASEKRTSIILYSYPIVKEGDDQTTSYEYQVSRELNKIDPEWVGTQAAEMTLRLLGPKTIDGGDLPVLLAPMGAGRVFASGFAGAVNAEEVQYGRSYISDAIGDEIASEQLTIVDDALLPAGIGSRAFDAEGVSSRKTQVVENGVLKSLLHNSYTANKDGVENTANASRVSYSGLPSISPSNFIITPDKGTFDDLVSEMGRGVICRNTGDRPNMTTGEMSAMILEGFYVENGEIKHALKNTLMGINMRDLLKRVVRVGADVRTTLSMITPSVMIERAMITSGS